MIIIFKRCLFYITLLLNPPYRSRNMMLYRNFYSAESRMGNILNTRENETPLNHYRRSCVCVNSDQYNNPIIVYARTSRNT